MYSASLRHSASVVQPPSGVAARLLSTTPGRVKIGRAGSFGGVEIPGLPPKESASETMETSTGTSGTTSAARPDPTAANNRTSINQYATRLNKYKAGQSPATVYPRRARTSQPGLSWLGDDEFESTGLAFKLARHHSQRVAASKPTGDSGSSKNVYKNRNPGSTPRRNDERPRIQAKAPDSTDKKASRPGEGLAQKSQPKRVDITKKTETREDAEPGVSTKPATRHRTPKPSPAPRTPVRPVQVDLKSTDFTSLFGASSSPSVASSSTSTKTTPTDNASRRVQLALEYHGGDYSKLVSSCLVTSQGSPLVYAESTMARRRELGFNRRNGALGIVQGMIGKSQGSQPIV